MDLEHAPSSATKRVFESEEHRDARWHCIWISRPADKDQCTSIPGLTEELEVLWYATSMRK